MISKRGISEVVATVLLILLTVAVAATLLGFLKPFVEKGLGDSTRCNAYENYIEFEDKLDNGTGIYNYNCWDSKTGYYFNGISIKTTKELNSEQLKKIKGFLITLRANSSNVGFNISNGFPTSELKVAGNYATNISINGALETNTYVYKSTEQYDTSEIYILLDSGACKIADSIKIDKCQGVSFTPW